MVGNWLVGSWLVAGYQLCKEKTELFWEAQTLSGNKPDQ
jgi:hypothetical protein